MPIFGLIVALALLGAGCDKLPFLNTNAKQNTEDETAEPARPQVRVTDPGVLAVVNGSPITGELFRQRVQGLPEANRPKTVEERRVFLDELVKEELLVQEAAALGLERDPQVKRQLDSARRLVLLNALTERDAGHGAVEDQDVRNYYDELQRVLGQRNIQKLRVWMIVAGTLAEAEDIRAKAVQGADVAQLARDRSIGAGREQGGDAGWYLKEADRRDLLSIDHAKDEKSFFPQMEPVAFSLEVGQISQPVKGPDDHYYLVKVEAREAVKLKPITEMWNKIHDALAMQKRGKQFQERLDRLTARAKIEKSEQRLEQM